MSLEKFEKQLASRRVRELPFEWREEILARARREGLRARLQHVQQGATWVRSIRAALWPHPVAWAVLVCLWIVPLAINCSQTEPSIAGRSAIPPSALELRLAREQRQMFLEELGGMAIDSGRSADRKQPALDGFRSDRESDHFGDLATPTPWIAEKELA